MLSTYLYNKYQEELLEMLPRLQSAHAELATSASPKVSGIRKEIVNGTATGAIAGLTPLPDALFLYLLVREYKPKHIFEIGTWVGTSVLFMAEALKKNGDGHIYTCDGNQYYILPEEYTEFVTPITGHSDDVLADFAAKGTTFDLMFIDGNLTTKSTKLIEHTSHAQTIFAIHDFVLPDDKGIQAFQRLPRKKDYGLSVPQPFTAPADNLAINKMIAVYLPSNTIPKKVAATQGVALSIYRLYLMFSYPAGRALKKCRLLLKK